ncbi:MAG: DEAD/DEAH box helicase family protein, partial [Treponema sp.]|nr:DEAD/DEAH box helicase family protein [Treponema sp.]
MKNQYGITPWGSWFVDVLDSYQMGARLDRGRTYANTGRVLSLALDEGRAFAKVEGKYRPSYRVEIIFPQLKEAEQVYKMIENDLPLLARIAAGELPETFLQKLKNKGINLIPRRWHEMKRSCTCPDDGDPCKHMAALYYIIAKEIDSDPHVLFRLRGMDLEARFGKAVVHSVTPPFAITYTTSEKQDVLSPEPLSGEILSLEDIPHCTELITTLLPAAPPFCSRDFTVVMAEFYHRCAHNKAWESAEADANTEMEHLFSRSVWTVVCPSPGPGAKVFLDMEDINGNMRRLSPNDAFDYFVYFSSEDGTASYSFLFYLFKFLNLVCLSGAFIPYVFAENKTLGIVWRPFETLPPVQAFLKTLASRESGMLTGKKTVSGRSVVDLLASAFLNEWIYRRTHLFGSSFSKYGTGEEYRELVKLFFYGKIIDISSPARRSLPVVIGRWLSVLQINFAIHQYGITVKDSTKDEALIFLISMDVLAESEGRTEKLPLSKVKDLEILRAPIALSNYLPEIRSLFNRSSVRLSEARLVSFLESSSSLLTRLGITVTLPKALAKELRPRLVVKGNASGASLKRYLDLNTLQDFEWQVAIGNEVMTVDEFEKLVKEKKAMVRFRDGFVKMDPEEFARLLKGAKKASPDFNDFLKAHFSGDTVLAFDARETIDNLFKERNFPIPKSLIAELRPYQKRGYNWVCSLLFSGFGCILADDMGLGKTVQSIAALLRMKEEKLLRNGCLVVAPASLLSNWEKELSRFAPSLKVSRYHGLNRVLNRKFDIFLTTYQTAVRDVEKLNNVAFSMLLVDEAHLMKNSETRVSRTVKLLRSQYRLALSGTPVENRLEDLRSLFDFILPGYLGNVKSFRDKYRIPIEVMRSREQAEALKRITSPFLLRRLKTDKKIIKDLPEKIVSNEYALLEKDQAALYESVVAESIRKSE